MAVRKDKANEEAEKAETAETQLGFPEANDAVVTTAEEANEPDFTPTMVKGARGSAVMAFQRALREAYPHLEPQLTGDYDDHTVAVVRAIQREAELDATGEVDAKTEKHLKGQGFSF